MKLKIDPGSFKYQPGKSKPLSELSTEVTDLYESKKEYRSLLKEYTEEIDELQSMMYAHGKYSMLLIFQGMDSAGKGGAIRHVMSGINPAGVHVSTFKRPSTLELRHDWMWRSTCKLPLRGHIGIFDRSYYEEVLVVRVHPGILTGAQLIPSHKTENVEQVFKERREDIVNFEDFLYRNGTHVVKFFLNLGYEEQRQRLLDRINEPAKNWKMNPGDVKERGRWSDYQNAFQEVLTETSKENAPWYVIPADDKKNARLIISQIVLEEMRKLKMEYPRGDAESREELAECKRILLSD